MRRKFRLSLEWTILLLFITIILLLIWSNVMPIKIFYPITALSFVGIIAGLFLPTIASTWLIILSFFIGACLAILGYMLIPIWERTILVLVLPVILAFSALIKRRAEIITNVKLDSNKVLDYVGEHDSTTNLLKTDEAENFYSQYINFLKKAKISAAYFSTTLISWSHSREYYQVDNDEADAVLNKLAKLLKNSRLPSERIFYLSNGYFLVLGPVHAEKILNELNRQSLAAMNNVIFHTDKDEVKIQFQLTDLIITNDNLKKYESFDSVTKKLMREQEMKLVREYQ